MIPDLAIIDGKTQNSSAIYEYMSLLTNYHIYGTTHAALLNFDQLHNKIIMLTLQSYMAMGENALIEIPQSWTWWSSVSYLLRILSQKALYGIIM